MSRSEQARSEEERKRGIRHIFRRFLGGEERESTGTPVSDARKEESGSRAPGPAASRAKAQAGKRPAKPSPGRPRGAGSGKPAKPDASGRSRSKPELSTDFSTLPETPFRAFGLDPRIETALVRDLGFRAPTPIQEKALPHTLSGKDLTGKAQTGTGKTAAFLITIYQRMLHSEPEGGWGRPGALIIAPTRELAIQIDRDAAEIGKHCGLRHLVVYGGTDFEKQQKALAKGVDILAATPGRLLDYVRRGNLDLSGVRILVIDEADRMLDMGFLPDVRRILGRLPKPERRQTLLFSATLSPEILRLAERWMRSPVRVEVEPEHIVARGITQVFYAAPSRDKLPLLLWLLKNEPSERVLVFRNRRNASDELYRQLYRYGVPCALLTGDVPQKKRTRILDDFRAGKIRVLVATDVAGRGIHVENITHVVNYDLPYEAEDYVHRIGRTGRAGAAGKAVSFVCEEGGFIVPEIEEFIGAQIRTVQPTREMLKMPPLPPESPRAPALASPPRKPRRRSSSSSSRRRPRRR